MQWYVRLVIWKLKNNFNIFIFISFFYTKDIQDRYRLNAPTFVNQKKVFSKKENPSMTLISRHSILSLQPTQFPFMYGLKQSVRWTAYKYLISKQWKVSSNAFIQFNYLCVYRHSGSFRYKRLHYGYRLIFIDLLLKAGWHNASTTEKLSSSSFIQKFGGLI